MSDDEAHEIGMAEQALSSVTADILLLALDPVTRGRLAVKDIGIAIERLRDAIVLIQQREAA